MSRKPVLRYLQLTQAEQFERYRQSLGTLLNRFLPILAEAGQTLEDLLDNLGASLPHVWLATDGQGVYGLASLTDEVPGVQAYIHGVTCPTIRRHPVISETEIAVMQYAFEELGIRVLRAVMEHDNPGVKGFCRRFGFRLEAVLPHASIYALDRAGYVRLMARLAKHHSRRSAQEGAR